MVIKGIELNKSPYENEFHLIFTPADSHSN